MSFSETKPKTHNSNQAKKGLEETLPLSDMVVASNVRTPFFQATTWALTGLEGEKWITGLDEVNQNNKDLFHYELRWTPADGNRHRRNDLLTTPVFTSLPPPKKNAASVGCYLQVMNPLLILKQLP